MNNYRFGLIGVAGYIAERHLRAIQETGNTLVAALDRFDSVGLIDKYFPDADFFTEFERYDRHLDKLRRYEKKIDYITICSPNYLHDSHIRFALRSDADAICEKPLVLNPWNIDALKEVEKRTGKNVYTILQLRYHPVIIELRKKVQASKKSEKYNIELTYITSRGKWYDFSWKGDIQKSGGIATNIGIHFFDMLIWIFGKVQVNDVHLHTGKKAAGYLELEKARVKWFLSIDYEDVPEVIKQKGQRTYRSVTVDNEEIEFSAGFTDLHTKTYQEILKGNGYGLNDARDSVQMVYDIRNSTPANPENAYHPLLQKYL